MAALGLLAEMRCAAWPHVCEEDMGAVQEQVDGHVGNGQEEGGGRPDGVGVEFDRQGLPVGLENKRQALDQLIRNRPCPW